MRTRDVEGQTSVIESKDYCYRAMEYSVKSIVSACL